MLRPDKSKNSVRNFQDNGRISSKSDALPQVEKKHEKVLPTYKNAKSKIADYIAGRITAKEICPKRKNKNSGQELSSSLSTSKPSFHKNVNSSREFLRMLPAQNKCGFRKYVSSEDDNEKSDSPYYAKVKRGNYYKHRRINNSNYCDSATGIDLNDSEIFGSKETMKTMSDWMNEIDRTTSTINQRYHRSPSESSFSYENKECSLLRTICASFDQPLSNNKHHVRGIKNQKKFHQSNFQTAPDTFRQTLKIINRDKQCEGCEKLNAQSTDFTQLGKANHLIVDRNESRIERIVSKNDRKISIRKILRNLIEIVGELSKEMNKFFFDLKGRMVVIDKKLTKLTTNELVTSRPASERESKDDQINAGLLDRKNGESNSNHQGMSKLDDNANIEQSSANENYLKNLISNKLEKAYCNNEICELGDDSNCKSIRIPGSNPNKEKNDQTENTSISSQIRVLCKNSYSEDVDVLGSTLTNEEIDQPETSNLNKPVKRVGEDSNSESIVASESTLNKEKIYQTQNASTNNQMSDPGENAKREIITTFINDLVNEKIDKLVNSFTDNVMGELCDNSNSGNFGALKNDSMNENALTNNQMNELEVNSDYSEFSEFRVIAMQSDSKNEKTNLLENSSTNLIRTLENTSKNTSQSVVFSCAEENSSGETEGLSQDSDVTSKVIEIERELELGQTETNNVGILISKLAQVTSTLKVKLLQNDDTSLIDTVDDVDCLKSLDIVSEDVYSLYKELLENCVL